MKLRPIKETLPGSGHSISPGEPCPETVLVARMTDGSYLLMAYPQNEPAAFVARDDACLLRQALTAEFRSPTNETARENGYSNGKVVPEHGAPHTEQAQP